MKQSKKLQKKSLSSQGVNAPKIHKLDCGLRVVYKKAFGTHTTHMGFVIGAGAINDPKGCEGTAHFFEHILFRNTESKSQIQIINQIERIGGDLNAFTAKEVTVVYANVLSKYYGKILKLLTEVVFKNKIREQDIVKEKAIIMDEIAMYQDSPEELIYDEFNEKLFEGSKYGNSILGNKKSLEKINIKVLELFYKKFYKTSNVVLSIVSNLEWKEVRKQFLFLESNLENQSFKEKEISKILAEGETFNKVVRKKLSQNYLCLGRKAYTHTHKNRIAFMLLNNILGGPGMNSILNLEIREKKALTYNIESSYTAYKEEGVFCVLIGADANNMAKSEKLIRKVLSRLVKHGVSDKFLRQSKRQFINQLLMAEESKHAMMVFNGKQVLWYDKIESINDFLEKVDNVGKKEIDTIAKDMFDTRNLSLLKYN